MSDKSKIEWTETTWNPTTGCTKVSPGCDNCYAETLHERFNGKGSFAVVTRSESKLYAPLSWRKPRRIFVNSMSDLFHDQVPLSFIERVFSVMARTPHHTYQLLTKRHARMASVLRRPTFRDSVASIVGVDITWPLPNLWLGVSVENQQWADIRIPALLDTPAAVRWLSMEPLLGPVQLDETWLTCDHQSHSGTDQPGMWVCDGCGQTHREVEDPTGPVYVAQVYPARRYQARYDVLTPGRLIDWVVVGGESGPKARPMHPGWARNLRNQCESVNVPFFFKQWGQFRPGGDPARPCTWIAPDGTSQPGMAGTPHTAAMVRVGKKAAGRLLDGRTWDEYPTRPAPVLA